MGDFSDCIGWFPGLLTTPAPGGDGTDDRLGTGMDMDVLDGDALLTLAAVTVEGFGQSRVGSRELGRLFQVLMPTVESLVPKHRMPVTLHGGVMARDQLRDQHSLDLVARLYANNSGERRLCPSDPSYRTRRIARRRSTPDESSFEEVRTGLCPGGGSHLRTRLWKPRFQCKKKRERASKSQV